MSKTFDQTTLGYVNGISMSASGCGPCSVASIVYNLDETITPEKVARKLYDMGEFFNSGTTRSGITAILMHYGFAEPFYYKPESSGGAPWSNAVKKMMELKKADKEFYIIFLAVATSTNTYWTSGGHYLSGTDVKIVGSEVYIRDSGARKRTGWHNLTELQYCTNVLWIVEPKEEIKRCYAGKLPYAGLFPDMTKSEIHKYKQTFADPEKETHKKQIQLLQLYLNWYFNDIYSHLKVTGEFNISTLMRLLRFKHQEGLKLSVDVDEEVLKAMKKAEK